MSGLSISGKDAKPKKVISQKEYLKKYLSGGKKKKIKSNIQKRVKIIDDNIDCVIDNDTTSENLIGFNPVDEYAPQIVGVIDERPQEVRTLDTYKNKTRWKRVGEDEDVQIKDETVNLHQVQNYVEQINKSTLNDILKKNNDEDVNGAPIRRDRKTGKKRDIQKEAKEEQEKNDIFKQHKEKYALWGKGLKQVESAKEKYQNDLHEMQKPLARYADDDDLENFLKSKIRDGDPMLKYITNKKDLREVSPDGVRHEVREFRGVCAPNRFNIRPGHRWDGVNRSNGYEEKWLLQKNSQKAIDDEAYKWSCSDM